MKAVPTIDPLTLAVVRGSLEQLAEEMDLTLKRTAFSPVISGGEGDLSVTPGPSSG